MSRTFRYIPHYYRTIQPYEKCWDALTRLGYTNWPYTYDPRNALVNGYDGTAQSYYKHYGKLYGKENYQGATRKFFKRHYARGRRRNVEYDFETED